MCLCGTTTIIVEIIIKWKRNIMINIEIYTKHQYSACNGGSRKKKYNSKEKNPDADPKHPFNEQCIWCVCVYSDDSFFFGVVYI